MTPKDVIEHYGGPQSAADALGISVQTIYCWVHRGGVPVGQQYRIQVLTGGRLRATDNGFRQTA